MTKGKVITISVSVELFEDTGKDLHTELTGIAHECLTALLAMVPEAQSRSVGFRVETLEDIGLIPNPRRLRKRHTAITPDANMPNPFLQPHLFVKGRHRGRCAACGKVSGDSIHETANDKPQ